MPDPSLRALDLTAPLVAARLPWLKSQILVGAHGREVPCLRVTLLSRREGELHLDLVMTGVEGWSIVPNVSDAVNLPSYDSPRSLDLSLNAAPRQIAEAFVRQVLRAVDEAEKAGYVAAGTSARVRKDVGSDTPPGSRPSTSSSPTPVPPARWGIGGVLVLVAAVLGYVIPVVEAALFVAIVTLATSVGVVIWAWMHRLHGFWLGLAAVILSAILSGSAGSFLHYSSVYLGG